MKPAKAYRLLVGAGFPAAAAVVMTAIGGAESGWNPNAIGDTALETSKWGPSVGIWQIRTLKAATGTGGPRDIRRLQGNPAAQAAAAHEIWTGAGFGAWSTFNSGAYKGFLHPGKNAGTTAAGAGGTVVETGFDLGGGGLLNPLNWPGAIGHAAGDAAGGVAGDVASTTWALVQPFLLTAMFATAGIALVVIGVTVTAKPAVDAASAKVDQIREQAGQAAQAAAATGAVA